MFRTVALSAGVTALLACPAFAHHPSGASSTGDAGPIATVSATTLEKGHSVAGVVVEAGGAASHAAIVAREYGLPGVMGVAGATARLHDGDQVVVDGSRGTVAVLSTVGPTP